MSHSWGSFKALPLKFLARDFPWHWALYEDDNGRGMTTFWRNFLVEEDEMKFWQWNYFFVRSPTFLYRSPTSWYRLPSFWNRTPTFWGKIPPFYRRPLTTNDNAVLCDIYVAFVEHFSLYFILTLAVASSQQFLSFSSPSHNTKVHCGEEKFLKSFRSKIEANFLSSISIQQ